VTDAEVATVIEIVRRLDGLPLAIELAAARLRTLPLDDIAARLSDRFRLLTGGSRTALPRHRTLRAVVEWSWDLLTADERRLAEQLAVFPSGVTAASAGAVCDVEADHVPDLLASLIDKSLLQPIEGGRRMRMLETIREYGSERLAERGDRARIRARHAEHFAAILAEALPHVTTADQLPYFALLAAERENILAAMRYRCDVGDADAALTIAVGLANYAMMLGNHAEISTWMADALAVPGGDEELRLIARAMLALNTAATGASAEEVADGMRGLGELAHQLADVDIVRWPMLGLLRSAVAFFAGDVELTERYMQQTLDGEDEWARASVRMFRANVAENNGDVEAMRSDAVLALEEFRELGERWGMASTLRGLAALHTLDGRLEEAAAAYEQALRLAAELNSREDEGYMLARLADVELRRGNVDQARHYVLRARVTAEEHGAPIEAVFTLAMLGAVERHAGDLDQARELQREAMRRITGLPKEHPAQGHIRAILLAVSARIAFDDEEFAGARDFARDAFEAAVGTRDMPVVASVGVTLAEVAAIAGDPAEAAAMLGAAARLRGADDFTACEIVRLTATLRAALGDVRFEQLYEQGKALDRESAIERLAPRWDGGMP
jgi:tetratricopeptide (TPR) repeat protein